MLRELLTTACAIALFAGVPFAQEPRLTTSAAVVPSPAAPGQDVTVEVTLDLQPGWHVYGSKETTGIPVSLTIEDAGSLEVVGEPQIPEGEFHEQHGLVSYWLDGRPVLRQTLKVPSDTPDGEITIRGRVDYMACDDVSCDPPATEPWSATLEVQADAPKFGIGSLRLVPEVARPGEVVVASVTATVAEGWHVYGKKDDNPVTLTAVDIGILEPTGTNQLPDGELHEVTQTIVNYWLTGSFEIRQAFRVPEDAKPGEIPLTVALAWMVCDENSCLPPEEKALAATLTIEEGPPRQQFGGIGGVGGDFGGLWGLILAAIGAGLFALLMPCTYPMIPITISFFTKQSASRSGSAAGLSLIYGIGIVLMFVAIGLFAAPVIVPFAAHWITNLVIAALFVFFALSLFGFIDLQPPRFLMDAAGKASTKGGLAGVFLMGATLVVTSFTCTAPFVGSLLAVAAAGGTIDVIIGMTAFGLTMAIPFVVLAMIPGRMQALPRAGEWMNTLKVFFGFIELAAALKFLSNVDIVLNSDPVWLPRDVFLWAWAVIFLAAGLFLLGAFGKVSGRPGLGRAAAAAVTIGLAVWFGYGALGNRLDPIMSALAPPRGAAKHEIIKDDYPAALAAAAEKDKLVMVNFTGFT